jgi:catechol 2,3-dioxygenase-like lactoylglutathione lyase family enzyme
VLQLALNVADIDQAIEYYSKLFDTEPAKVRAGYANFAITDPLLKLVLIEDPTTDPGSINHLGVEVDSSEEAAEVHSRLDAKGLPIVVEGEVTCCYAPQDKIWVDGPRALLGDLHRARRL